MFTHNTYVLASSSRSRYNILKNSGFNFIQVKPKCNEEEIKNKIKSNRKKTIKPSNLAKILSLEKALSVSKKEKYYDFNVIGCDTLIYLNNKVFDKAKSIKEARLKIKLLSGKTHKIVSGLTICKRGVKIWQCSTTTSVKIKKLKPSQINMYLKKTGKQILGSVGCYQVESLGPNIVEDIRGDFFNVMGLPLFKLLKYTSAKE